MHIVQLMYAVIFAGKHTLFWGEEFDLNPQLTNQKYAVHTMQSFQSRSFR